MSIVIDDEPQFSPETKDMLNEMSAIFARIDAEYRRAVETPITMEKAREVVATCKAENIDPAGVVRFLKGEAHRLDAQGWTKGAWAQRESIQRIGRVVEGVKTG